MNPLTASRVAPINSHSWGYLGAEQRHTSMVGLSRTAHTGIYLRYVAFRSKLGVYAPVVKRAVNGWRGELQTASNNYEVDCEVVFYARSATLHLRSTAAISRFPRDDLDHATDLPELTPLASPVSLFPLLTLPATSGELLSSPKPPTGTGDVGTFGDSGDCGGPRLPRLSLPCWWWCPPGPNLLLGFFLLSSSSSSSSTTSTPPPLARFPKEVELSLDRAPARGEVLIAGAPTASLASERWLVGPTCARGG